MMTVVDRLDLSSQEGATAGRGSVRRFGPGLPPEQPGQGEWHHDQCHLLQTNITLSGADFRFSGKTTRNFNQFSTLKFFPESVEE